MRTINHGMVKGISKSQSMTTANQKIENNKYYYRLTNKIFSGKLKYLSRFSVVGVLNTLVDFLMFTAAFQLIGLNYTVSQVVGYSCGIINSFIFNKNWTFEGGSAKKKTIHELIQFLVINIGTLLVTLFCMKGFVNNLGMNVYVSKILITLIAQVINFVSYRFLVFKK